MVGVTLNVLGGTFCRHVGILYKRICYLKVATGTTLATGKWKSKEEGLSNRILHPEVNYISSTQSF